MTQSPIAVSVYACDGFEESLNIINQLQLVHLMKSLEQVLRVILVT